MFPGIIRTTGTQTSSIFTVTMVTALRQCANTSIAPLIYYAVRVIVNYIATNPRDRSHYEQFSGYSSALNRFVEPTSVTPAAEPALKRSIPTCIVMLAKLVLDLSQWSQADQFNYTNNNLAKELFGKFEERLIKADPSEEKNIKNYIHNHLNEWENLIARENRVHYHAKHKAPKDVKFLTKDFGDVKNDALWQILNSMRHVDTEVGITIE